MRPVASTPYQKRPGDFFTLSQCGWKMSRLIGSHGTVLKRKNRFFHNTDVCFRDITI